MANITTPGIKFNGLDATFAGELKMNGTTFIDTSRKASFDHLNLGGATGDNGEDGTAGSLVVYVSGAISGSGDIISKGAMCFEYSKPFWSITFA